MKDDTGTYKRTRRNNTSGYFFCYHQHLSNQHGTRLSPAPGTGKYADPAPEKALAQAPDLDLAPVLAPDQHRLYTVNVDFQHKIAGTCTAPVQDLHSML